MTVAGRYSPYTVNPGVSFVPAANGKLPPEPGTTPIAYIGFR